MIVWILGFVWVCTAHADLFLCKTFVLSHDLQLTIMQVVGTGVKIESRRIHVRNRARGYNLHARIMILFFGPHTGSNYSNFVALSYQTPCVDQRLQGRPPAEFRSESSSILSPLCIGLPSAILGVIALSLPARPELRSPWLPLPSARTRRPALLS